MEVNTDTDEEDGTTANTEMNDINLAILNENKKNEDDSGSSVEPPEDDGLFVHTPRCFKNAFLSVYGLLFFLCWASTIQVIISYLDITRVLVKIYKDNYLYNSIYFIFLLQGATVNGLINLGLSTLERRFNLKSVQTGFIAGSYDIGFMAATLPISYFGGMKGASKPRYLW